MTTTVVVVDRLPEWSRNLHSILDDAVGETAKDILIDSRGKAPYKKGGLRRESDTNQISSMHHRVSYWLEYSAAQEAGKRKGVYFKRYTTPGTGPHFLQTAGDKRVETLKLAIRKHQARIMS